MSGTLLEDARRGRESFKDTRLRLKQTEEYLPLERHWWGAGSVFTEMSGTQLKAKGAHTCLCVMGGKGAEHNFWKRMTWPRTQHKPIRIRWDQDGRQE